MDMDLKLVDKELRRVLELVASVPFTSIEQDVALEHLRRAYEELRFGEIEPTSAPSATEPVGNLLGAVSALVDDTIAEEQTAEEPEIEVELIMSDEVADDDEMVAEEPTAEPTDEPTTEEVAKPTIESVAELVIEPTAKPQAESVVEPQESQTLPQPEVQSEPSEPIAPFTEQSLFGDDSFLAMPSKGSHRRAIMSLYEETPELVEPEAIEPVESIEAEPELVADIVTSEPTAELEAFEAEPELQSAEGVTAEPEMVLGDMYRRESHATLGESVAAQPTVAESHAVESLRGAISVADRFMIIRDLFEGDARLYEKTITELDSFKSLDDCLVYIVENFSWRPSSDGAKLIMELLQRKFK